VIRRKKVSSFGQWVTQVRTSGSREEGGGEIVARTVSAIRKFIFAVAFERRGNSIFSYFLKTYVA
jgi:hypothetical protein